MSPNKGKILLNTLFWGFILWLVGYILGIIFFKLVPQEQIGWYVMPLGILFTLWVLTKKIKRDSFTCYIGLGIIWTIMALLLDYFFLVKMFNASDYYKLDVYIYYIVTLLLPVLIAWRKFAKK